MNDACYHALPNKRAHPPAFLTDERVQRIWAIASGLVVGALAWYLGTSADAAALRSLGVPDDRKTPWVRPYVSQPFPAPTTIAAAALPLGACVEIDLVVKA